MTRRRIVASVDTDDVYDPADDLARCEVCEQLVDADATRRVPAGGDEDDGTLVICDACHIITSAP